MERQYASAREFFEAARAASIDAERCRRELRDMEDGADTLGGSGFEPRVRSTPDPDRIGRTVATRVDRRAMLERRQDEDYRLIDAACSVLYGTDSDAGLWALVGWRADAIYHHYLALRTWAETGALVGYSEQHVRREAQAALDVADANGTMWTMLGVGMAQG